MRRGDRARVAAGWPVVCLAMLAILAIAIGAWQLERARQEVRLTTERLGSMPVTVFRASLAPPGPGERASPAKQFRPMGSNRGRKT